MIRDPFFATNYYCTNMDAPKNKRSYSGVQTSHASDIEIIKARIAKDVIENQKFGHGRVLTHSIIYRRTGTGAVTVERIDHITN